MDYFCVDIETSGPVPGTHSLLSLGVVHVRRFGGRYQLMDDAYWEFQPAFPGVLDAAMAVCGLDLERLKRDGHTPEQGMKAFADWVNDRKKQQKERPIFVAHNAPFDWMFCVYYFHLAGIENPFGHSALDAKAFAMGKLDVSWNETSLRLIANHLGFPERDTDNLHHALEDARYQAKIFCALMDRSR